MKYYIHGLPYDWYIFFLNVYFNKEVYTKNVYISNPKRDIKIKQNLLSLVTKTRLIKRKNISLAF